MEPPEPKKTPLTPEQRRLVEENLDLAEAAAEKVARRGNPSIVKDDLIACGYVGLIEAAQRFDPAQGTPFRAFAYARVRGEILDKLRKEAGYTIADRRTFNAQEQLEFYRQRKEALSETMEHLAQFLASSGPVSHRVGIEEAANQPTEARSAESMVHIAGLRDRFARAAQELETVEREMVRLYHFEGKSLEEAGAELGVRKSWASRILSRAMRGIAAAVGNKSTE